MKFQLIKSPIERKKWRAIFTDERGHEIHTDFGDSSMQDYTQHRNPIRRSQYLARHLAREDWLEPTTAGSLSRWILWDTPSLETNVRRFKKRFNLE
jgi:hypothetical protein